MFHWSVMSCNVLWHVMLGLLDCLKQLYLPFRCDEVTDAFPARNLPFSCLGVRPAAELGIKAPVVEMIALQ